MKNTLLFLLINGFVICGICQVEAPEKKPLTIGEQITLHSQILDQDRLLNIYLPASYHPDSLNRYPVIYLLDGSIHEDFLHIVGLVQFGSYPWINMLPESIVVGISNIDRKHDFTFPTTIEEDKKDFPTTGGSAAFIECLGKEIQPLIEKTYPADGTSTLIGQSLGGLVATEILLKHPDLFNRYMIVSPSLWWDNESLLKFPLPEQLQTKEIYIAVGKEGEVMENDTRALHSLLGTAKNAPSRLYFSYFPEHDHGDILHQAIYQGFQTLFQSTTK
ncbi:MAG: esterase [Bacteroidetes bacterium RIFCSPHIGHO2_02_FULL_44_7]|nr:MAG: esterase [Bacteroidetes bacterium RIFCSPHIGHO2_02_FULL_44_7]